MAGDLFARLVACSGLSSIFAEKALRRALSKAGVDPLRLTAQDVARALPEIERVLATYLDGNEVARRIKAVAQLAG
jgi:hypothetical protein